MQDQIQKTDDQTTDSTSLPDLDDIVGDSTSGYSGTTMTDDGLTDDVSLPGVAGLSTVGAAWLMTLLPFGNLVSALLFTVVAVAGVALSDDISTSASVAGGIALATSFLMLLFPLGNLMLAGLITLLVGAGALGASRVKQWAHPRR